MKKLISLLLSFVLLACSLSVSATAFADDSKGSAKNPFYSEKASSKFQPLLASYSVEPDYYEYKNDKYYTENDALYKIVRNGLGARSKKVSFKLYSSGRIYSYQTVAERLFEEATEDRLSVSSTDGDYARWNVSSIGWSFSYEIYNGAYYYDVDLKFSYYSTDDEEQKVDAKINSIVNSVRKMNVSDYEVVKYIHDLICSSAKYDYDAAKYSNSDKYNYAFSAYGVLCKGIGVCQSYANAFYRICRELGYNVRFVSSSPYEGCHAWNLIQLDDKYYFVDCTWDDEIRDNKEMAEEFLSPNINGYSFLLVDYDTLRSEDTHREHTLYPALYEDEYYTVNFANKTSTTPYDYKTAKGLSTFKIALSQTSFQYNSKAQTPNITIKDKTGNSFNDYSLTFSNNINCGRVKVRISGKNNLAGYVTYRSYNIVPSKMTDISHVSGSRTTNSFQIKWKNYSGGANGYQLQQFVDGEWKTIKNFENETSFTLSKLTPSTKYSFRIRTYKIINNYKYYGEFSDVFSNCTIPKNASKLWLTTKSKAITVKWKKVACSGYEIQYKTGDKIKTVSASSSATSKKIKSLKKGKKYSVRIRAYKTLNGKKYYSSWSNRKYIKVK